MAAATGVAKQLNLEPYFYERISYKPEGSTYTIAKVESIALTKCMEYGKDNIRAYTFDLGNIQTLATYGQITENDRRKAAAEASMRNGESRRSRQGPR